MNRKVLILGATGGFGRAAMQQMIAAGWQVRALSRRGSPASNSSNVMEHNNRIEWIKGSLEDYHQWIQQAHGVDAIVHAVNVPYPQWDTLMPDYTKRIIELAKGSGAHLLFVGNIYNAGIPVTGIIDENTPDRPVNDLGKLRMRLETMLALSTEAGVRCTVMRFGDFFGPGISTPNWMNQCTKAVVKNKLVVPGSLQASHAWAYVPDAAKAMEQVVSIRLNNEALPAYMEIPFAGHQFSFEALQALLENARGKPLKITRLPWRWFRVIGLFLPLFRDLVSMRYLWDHSIRMDGSALTRLLGREPEHTPLDVALFRTLEGQM